MPFITAIPVRGRATIGRDAAITGWNYVAIRAKCIQGMQAKIRVYHDNRSAEAKALRKRARDGYGRIESRRAKGPVRPR